MLTEEQLDQLIRQAVKEMVESVEVPDRKASWKRLQRKIRIRRAKRLAVRTVAIAAMIMLCFGTTAVLAPHPVKALGKKIWSGFITIIQGDKAIIQFSYTDPGPHPPDSPQTIIKPEDDSLREIAAKCPFPVLVPQYLPPGYTLSKVTYSPLNKNDVMLEIQYFSGQHSLVFAQWNAGNQGSGYGYDIQDTAVSDITVRGRPGKQFYSAKDNFTQWIWVDGEINYRIAGAVSPAEMQGIVASFRNVKQ